ncbi:uncharacterized protein J7T54_002860 [Emericellopsis cladophorae]|uniref:Uncharacterized protein n=1 Tax=Emericellopsis cladophorae TaxID=2686198 RepID=A0A9P9XYY0_9HYPO|nr:uncharacterized protein J7T54_002860 [Emericellopsis cladophorae]KAI6780463.1 hypothetical protein J7T54_002860 [Emericellopsis cladophorae]
MSKSSSSFTSYTDAASTYWPPGWNFQRYAHATPADDAALSDEERAKMQAGFREALGEDGVMDMAHVVWQEQLRRIRLEKESSSAATASSSSSVQKQQQQQRQRPPPPPPDWLKIWRKRAGGDGGGAWGFVAFCTSSAVAAMPESDVAKFHTRAREMAEMPIQKALEEEGQPADEIAEARRSFEIRWVEMDDDDEDAEGEEGKGEAGTGGDWVEKARASYRAMRESGVLPSGLDLPVFLCASPAAVASVLRTSPAEAKEAHEEKPRWRSGDVPFLLVAAAETEQGIVEEDDDEEEEETHVGCGERNWFKPVFKAAAEVLVDELWWVVAEQMMSLGQMTRFVRGATVAEEHVTTTEEERQGEGGEAADVGSGRADEPGHDDDGLDGIWWTVHIPPRLMRRRRRVWARSG